MARKIQNIGLYTQYDNIYSIVPEYLKLRTVPEKIVYISKKLIRFWFEKHKGKENAETSVTISKELGFDTKGTCVYFRNIVAILVEIDHFPIVSSQKGYYLAISNQDIEESIETEEKRKKGLERRILALRRITTMYQLNNQMERKNEQMPLL